MTKPVASLALLLCFLWSFGAVAAGRCCPGDAAEATRGTASGDPHAAHAEHGAEDEEAPPPCHCLDGSCAGSSPAHPTPTVVLRNAGESASANPVTSAQIAETPGTRLLPWSIPPPAWVV
jgi:hypothetical protein